MVAAATTSLRIAGKPAALWIPSNIPDSRSMRPQAIAPSRPSTIFLQTWSTFASLALVAALLEARGAPAEEGAAGVSPEMAEAPLRDSLRRRARRRHASLSSPLLSPAALAAPAQFSGWPRPA